MTLGDLGELGKIRRIIDSSRLWNSKSDGNELLRINFGINSTIHILILAVTREFTIHWAIHGSFDAAH